jgi:hypothetical protein
MGVEYAEQRVGVKSPHECVHGQSVEQRVQAAHFFLGVQTGSELTRGVVFSEELHCSGLHCLFRHRDIARARLGCHLGLSL